MRWHDEAPEGKLDLLLFGRLPDDLDDAALRRRVAGGDLVREARPLLHRHAPVRARLHAGHRPAVGGQERLRDLPPARPEALATWPAPISVCARTSSACRCSTTPRARPPSPAASSGTGAHGQHGGDAGQDHARLHRRRARLHGDRRQARRRRARSPTSSASPSRTSPTRSSEPLDRLGPKNGVMLGGAADGRPAIDTDAKLAEAILTFSGTTNGELAVQGFRTLEKRVGKKLVDLAEGSEEKRITFADTQAGAGAGDHLAGVVGLGDRRTALCTVHRQHRTAQAVAHPDRPDALLPRPRLDARPRRGAADLPAAAGHAPALRRAGAGPGRRQGRSRCAT